ncbi:MAG: Holliday junction branch migration protein RuvA [Clostridiales bacterium]|nr:Holliday junction branch migration protein RuvA [Clostridiales bacterium]
MIYSLRGEVIHLEQELAVIECGGVGYACKTTMSTLSQIGSVGQDAVLFTYLNVRQDAVELFGFATKAELGCFEMLLSVSGVGPKAALSILSDNSPEGFALAVASDDVKTLTRSRGIGMKTAQRIVLELKDKVAKADLDIADEYTAISDSPTGNVNEAISALAVLGYSKSEAARAISKLPADTSVEEMIKIGLKNLAAN